MTVAELMAELQKWPSDSDVMLVSLAGDAYTIREVSGAAGSRIDGADSCVTLDFSPPVELCDWCDERSSQVHVCEHCLQEQGVTLT